ncbi:MAG TPA: oxidoreductase [Rhodospirillaceae bacterium]|nr:oxidoreductase [Rhodospirillaceae bacterium]HAA91437.1 oxidoreductase [Rhodospirillaceae bacterium]HAT35117.1 oxidoreductase [Rhodospirillaceae bacterium]
MPVHADYKHALITGATSGIGECFAELLPATTNLILTGRDETKLADLKERLTNGQREVETIAADLADAEARKSLLEKTVAAPLDLLINNAGLGAYGAFTEIPPERESEMVEVNVTAVIELSRALLPQMIERARADLRRAGMIVVSSTASVTPVPFLATYAATKAFERHWGEALAEELRSDPIDILVLCPGATRTEFFNRAEMDGSMLNNMEEPEAVARKALAALGRHTVFVSNGSTRLALAPAILPRRLLTKGIGHFLRGRR